MSKELIKKLFELSIKHVSIFLRKMILKLKNRNKFFVGDYKEKEAEKYYYYKKIAPDKYGVFYSKNNKEPVRIYEKPIHNYPKKLARQYAEKLAQKEALSTK